MRSIIEYYGANHQLAKAVEEQTELIHVIARRQQSGKWDEGAFLEELADVYAMLEQLKLIYCSETDMTLQDFNNKLDRNSRLKMKRTVERMKEGK